ncbi:MAG: hypothetical protein LBT40_02705, partial [Deltaproteobacteria bacterium]|nr:hypothetical protein [Deltaproteobacteria bacterium]
RSRRPAGRTFRAPRPARLNAFKAGYGTHMPTGFARAERCLRSRRDPFADILASSVTASI